MFTVNVMYVFTCNAVWIWTTNIAENNSFKPLFQGHYLQNHKPMITSFLKRLFLQGMTFCAVHNPALFSSFMAVSSLSFKLNDFRIVAPFYFM